MVRKQYRERVVSKWKIIEKETVDEIILRTTKPRNRLMLELMARGGMRIGEVLKLRLKDLQDRKLILQEPKSGREHELVFIPQKVADRLREYALEVCKSPDDRIFPISYEGARVIVAKAGRLVGIKLRPHDLRRHSATYASRSGVPIEIVSKVHSQACKSVNHSAVSGIHKRCRSHQVDREHLWVVGQGVDSGNGFTLIRIRIGNL
jgi:integrase